MMEAAVETKTCSKCGETKPFDAFNKQAHGKYGLDSRCRLCANEQHRQRRITPEGREVDRQYKISLAGRESMRRAYIRRKGISVEDYEALFIAQGGRCAQCGQPEREVSRHGSIYHLTVSVNPLTGGISLFCRGCFIFERSNEAAKEKAHVIQQLSKLEHVAWLAASSQTQVADARQLLEMIANGRLSDLTTIRLSARGFFIKHPSSAD
jgi:hypothetical protein